MKIIIIITMSNQYLQLKFQDKSKYVDSKILRVFSSLNDSMISLAQVRNICCQGL